MNDPEQIRETARSIKPFLRELVPEHAELIDKRLSELLGRDEPQDELLLELLSAYPGTREWISSRLAQGTPGTTRGFLGTIGAPAALQLEKYSCPGGDYNWYATSVGEEIPLCPNHNIPLQSVAKKTG